MDFHGFVSGAVDVIGAMSDRAAAMDGRAAFVLGMLTWFGVEQAVRKLAGLLRWAILVTAIGAGGVAVVAMVAAAVGGHDPSIMAEPGR